MAGRTIHKLSDTSIRAEKAPGRHGDGGGLYLNVSAAGSKSWLFLWTPAATGKRREAGLGPYPSVTLAKARSKAAEYRSAVSEGRDPIAERDAELRREKVPTFGECAERYIDSIKSEWRNAKHAYQWRQTLSAPCAPIRDRLISSIGTEDVLAVLEPLWIAKPETAGRLRGRLERVLNFAKTKGWRSGENPAAWRGHLANLLPKHDRRARKHQPAMEYSEIPAFMTQLDAMDALGARALEFTILTAARTGESINARWSEFDLTAMEWTVPAERMKAGKEHTVPLVGRALEIIQQQKALATSEFVFPGRPKRPLSNMAMLMVLRRGGHPELTVHGFRSSFRDWAGDVTSFPREVAEAALAHKVGDAVEQAYRRKTGLEKRRQLMQAWGDYCTSSPVDNVVPMTPKRTA